MSSVVKSIDFDSSWGPPRNSGWVQGETAVVQMIGRFVAQGNAER